MKIIKEALEFLEQNKDLVGLHAYKVLLANELHDLGGDYAQVSIDMENRIIKVVLSKEYENHDDKRNILIHELIHGRILLYRKVIKAHVDLFEEELVNDLTQGLMKFMK
ncbi:hypothetical protein [Oceanihabitans sediminis]|uniref:hypothetical protein n=1 Tax=Oceanihabitans sediminis TaxID=1812012 RepID=UPI00299D5F76|nr:hypothetical protein [Oceanihabitans sediminis]MDX1279464.1 hypothetical protein [Oceanihabitans sediminis]